MDLDKATKDAVSKVIAEKILSGIGTEHRDAILCKSIEESLKDFEVKQAIEKVVAAKAARITVTLLEEKEFAGMVRACCLEAMKKFLGDLQEAMEISLQECIVGKAGDTYSRKPGLILESLEKIRKERTAKGG